MLHRLKAFAKEHNVFFGVKLSNTLPVKITQGELPGEEMYMSGRSLYPLTINLAYKLAAEFNGDLKISILAEQTLSMFHILQQESVHNCCNYNFKTWWLLSLKANGGDFRTRVR